VVVAGWQLVDDLREHCLANIHAECTDRTADVPGASSTTALITLQIRAARSRNREAGKPPRALRHAAAFTLVPSAARLSRRSSFIRDSQVRHHWPDAARAFRVRSGGLGCLRNCATAALGVDLEAGEGEPLERPASSEAPFDDVADLVRSRARQ
jgi:hypothetical protein